MASHFLTGVVSASTALLNSDNEPNVIHHHETRYSYPLSEDQANL